MWRAPFTGGYEKTLPSKWEVELFEAEDRSAEKYGGYYLVIPFGDVTKNCIFIS